MYGRPITHSEQQGAAGETDLEGTAPAGAGEIDVAIAGDGLHSVCAWLQLDTCALTLERMVHRTFFLFKL